MTRGGGGRLLEFETWGFRGVWVFLANFGFWSSRLWGFRGVWVFWPILAFGVRGFGGLGEFGFFFGQSTVTALRGLELTVKGFGLRGWSPKP